MGNFRGRLYIRITTTSVCPRKTEGKGKREKNRSGFSLLEFTYLTSRAVLGDALTKLGVSERTEVLNLYKRKRKGRGCRVKENFW